MSGFIVLLFKRMFWDRDWLKLRTLDLFIFMGIIIIVFKVVQLLLLTLKLPELSVLGYFAYSYKVHGSLKVKKPQYEEQKYNIVTLCISERCWFTILWTRYKWAIHRMDFEISKAFTGICTLEILHRNYLLNLNCFQI